MGAAIWSSRLALLLLKPKLPISRRPLLAFQIRLTRPCTPSAPGRHRLQIGGRHGIQQAEPDHRRADPCRGHHAIQPTVGQFAELEPRLAQLDGVAVGKGEGLVCQCSAARPSLGTPGIPVSLSWSR